MAGSLSDYGEKLAMDFLMTTGAVTRPSVWYMALASSATDDTASGGTEIAGTGYARQAIGFSATALGTGATANAADVTFTAGGAWGTATDWIIFDAQTGGNRIWHGTLDFPRNFQTAGDSITIKAGSLKLTID